MKIGIISNGHGEDSIALTLITSFQKHHKNIAWKIVPLVGKGHAYTSNGFTPIIHNPIFPSGGFIRSLSDLITDIRAGLLRHILYQRRTIKRECSDCDIVIAVGDVFCLWMSAQGKTPLYFLPTAKSDTFMPHSKAEAWLMKRWCKAVFPRDEQTANALKALGAPAQYKGNVMMDNVLTNDPIPGLSETQKPIIGILPGSRDEAYENLVQICRVVDELGPEYAYALARSEALEEEKIKAIIGTRDIVITRHFNAVINRATLVIGLAGTGNEQAAYIGKPVICFEGTGPQTTAKRFLEQQKLMGKNIYFVENAHPNAIATAIKNLKLDKKKENITSNSASEAILSVILGN